MSNNKAVGPNAGSHLTTGKNCIFIGAGAGSDITNEDYKIRLKTKSVNISDDLSDREYKLVRGVFDALMDLGYLTNNANKIRINNRIGKIKTIKSHFNENSKSNR